MQQPRARTPLKSFPDHRKLLNGGFSDDDVLFIFMLCLSACHCCPQAQLYMGGLSPQPPLPILGEKLHQVFHNVLENLQNVMNGYCLPEPYFSAKVRMFSSSPVKNQAWEKCWLGICWLSRKALGRSCFEWQRGGRRQRKMEGGTVCAGYIRRD